MRRWLLTCGLVAGAANGMAFTLEACGGSSSCSETQTCSPADAAAESDATSPVDSGVHDATVDASDTTITTGDSSVDTSIDATPDVSDAQMGFDAFEADTSDGYDGFTCNTSLEPMTEPCVIDNSLGVFVAPPMYGGMDGVDDAGTDAEAGPTDAGIGGDGTKEYPYATISYALTQLHSLSRIYVCAATYPEAVTLTAVQQPSIYGGLACPGADAGVAWSYTGAKATVAPPSVGPALTINATTQAVTVADVEFDAQPANQSVAGSSSFAAVVTGAVGVTLERTSLVAGAGAAGATGGSAPENHTTMPLNGVSATGATAGGALGITCMLPPSASSSGGGGGGGGTTVAGAGLPGGAIPTPITMGVNDGAGGVAATLTTLCSIGFPGSDGASGGAGSPGASGTLTGGQWSGGSGGPGGAGNPGGGGGGGGGSLGVSPGAGGGGGGAGGCGGGPGQGGAGGGASFALVVVNSPAILTSCTFVSEIGGMGGNASSGQDGQSGGVGGVIPGGCGGGNGGTGGGGGGGGGGAGGPSVGIAWTGMPAPTVDGMIVTSPTPTLPGPSTFTSPGGGMGGTGGMGGNALNAGAMGNPGTPGASAAAMSF